MLGTCNLTSLQQESFFPSLKSFPSVTSFPLLQEDIYMNISALINKRLLKVQYYYQSVRSRISVQYQWHSSLEN